LLSSGQNALWAWV